MQAVDPTLGAGGRGRLQRVRASTRDWDIVAYILLAVGVDPERHPKDTSRTDAEKAAAREVAERVRAWFHEWGIHPLWADSGNGYHLLVPTRARLSAEVGRVSADARTLLELLDARFSTPGAVVDTSTFNPSRILRLSGAMAVKGKPRAERPHRVAAGDVCQVCLGTISPALSPTWDGRPHGTPRSARSARSANGWGDVERRHD